MISKEILVSIFRVGKIVSDVHSLIRAEKYPHQNFSYTETRARKITPSGTLIESNTNGTHLPESKVYFLTALVVYLLKTREKLAC